jgi:PAT family beta-lactamase induction signal transducer AmpG
VLQGVTMAILAGVPPTEGLSGFAAVALLASIGMALYDTCTDGLALDATPDDERGIIQGFMVGGRAAGILVMLLVGGQIAERWGWQWVFYAVGLLALLPVPLVWRVQEDPSQMHRQAFQWRAFKAFGQPAVVMLAALGLVYSLAIDGIYTFLSDHLRDVMAVSIGSVGALIALAMVGRILGAFSNSWLTDRVGHKQSLWVAIALTSVSSLGLALGGGVTWVAIFGFFFGLAYGYYTSVYAAVAMDFSDPHISASMFAIFMMFINLGTVGGQMVGGALTESLGFKLMCLVLGGINLLNMLLAFGVFRSRRATQVATSP